MSEDKMWNLVETETSGVEQTTITVKGHIVDITDKIGKSFSETIINTAREYDLGKFRAYLLGEEITPSNAPEVIEKGMTISLEPYDWAA